MNGEEVSRPRSMDRPHFLWMGQIPQLVAFALANASALGDPTLGVIAGGRFYFNANAQWDLFADDGTITDPVKLKEAVVLSVPLR